MNPLYAHALLLLICLTACSQQPSTSDESAGSAAQSAVTSASPAEQAVQENPQRDAYFGDLHVHTSYSLDAYIFGTTNEPRTAYRFARGEEVEIAGGIPHRLRRPLDFAAVTDHAETFAEIQFSYLDPDSLAYDSDYAQRIRANDVQAFLDSMTTNKVKDAFFGGDVELEQRAARSIWQSIQNIADEFYEPGVFTTLKAWEYSWARPDQMMLHRNIIFRGDEVTADAMSSFDLNSPEKLWEYLDLNCSGECRVLSIPHNANWSWGYAFSLQKPDGNPYSRRDLERRAELERLVEIQQVKGNSEAFLGLGATDEEANYEQLFTEIGELGETAKMVYGSTVRNGLKLGLQVQRELGFNPFKVGIIASTDNHNGVAGDTQEDTYNGHEGILENRPEQRRGGSHSMIAGGILNNPGGLAGVWADANTRGQIWDALARRECWGTSGTRIQVRFFGGFDYTEAMVNDDLIVNGYALGVPMGGDLTVTDVLAPPRFLIWALKDPDGANLDKVQVVKGWVDTDGEMHERVYDVLASDDRALGEDGRFPSVGITVDAFEASYTNSIGDAQLTGYWQDPDFGLSQGAFYYARVLEIPTPRYSTYDARRLGQDPAASPVPVSIQERAWTSPIWYTP